MTINFESLIKARNAWRETDKAFRREEKKAKEEVSILVKRYLENNRSFTVELSEEEFNYCESLFCVDIEMEELPIKLQFRAPNDKVGGWTYDIGCKQIDANFYFIPLADNNLTVQGQLDILFVCKTEKENLEKRKKITMMDWNKM